MNQPIRPQQFQLNQTHSLRYDGGHAENSTVNPEKTAPNESSENSFATELSAKNSQSISSQARSAEMPINGPSSVSNAFPIQPQQPAQSVKKTAEAQPVAATRDEVEISSAGKMLSGVDQPGEIRAERLARIKAAVDAGEYDTDEKLEAALSRMIQSIDID